MEFERKLTPMKTAWMIDFLKERPFLHLDIYGNLLLSEDQQNTLNTRREDVDSLFLSQIYSIKPGGLYFFDATISTCGENPLEHDILIEPKTLSGEQIVKIGFSRLYGRNNNPKRDESGRAINILSIERIRKNYLLEIGSFEIYGLKLNERKIIKRNQSNLISLIETELN